jgi:hypothetical protein
MGTSLRRKKLFDKAGFAELAEHLLALQTEDTARRMVVARKILRT